MTSHDIKRKKKIKQSTILRIPWRIAIVGYRL